MGKRTIPPQKKEYVPSKPLKFNCILYWFKTHKIFMAFFEAQKSQTAEKMQRSSFYGFWNVLKKAPENLKYLFFSTLKINPEYVHLLIKAIWTNKTSKVSKGPPITLHFFATPFFDTRASHCFHSSCPRDIPCSHRTVLGQRREGRRGLRRLSFKPCFFLPLKQICKLFLNCKPIKKEETDNSTDLGP